VYEIGNRRRLLRYNRNELKFSEHRLATATCMAEVEERYLGDII